MIDFQSFLHHAETTRLKPWAKRLTQKANERLTHSSHGDLPKWLKVLQSLPAIESTENLFTSNAVTFLTDDKLTQKTQHQIKDKLGKLKPWRKGPFDVCGIYIDTEWRSDWKWDRLSPHISPLRNRLVLDVGCGSGYHCFRMLGAGAKSVLGIDPHLLYVIQFYALRHFAGDMPVHVLPLSLEDMPEIGTFDMVFSMGVLYHRREPLAHLAQLITCLTPHGELVLETLVHEEKENEIIEPKGRYAKMRNIWSIPSCKILTSWLKQAGFVNIRTVDINQTSIEEQRTTEWMPFESLQDFLNPTDHNVSIEGYPAPKRAILIAEKPS